MLRKNTFSLQPAFLELLAQKTIAIEQQISIGELPQEYEHFVAKLFKQMHNAQDELIHGVMGISGEAGELTDCVKKHVFYEKALDEENLVEELGDLRFYYQALLTMFGLTDDLICQMNMDKLQKRYPKGEFSNEAAQERADKTLTLVT